MRGAFNQYNTDAGSGTFDRLRQLAFRRSSQARSGPIVRYSISQTELHELLHDLFGQFRRNAFVELSERAMKRVQKPGRWAEISCSSLICEVVTDNLVRKGPLSVEGRLARCERIHRAIVQGSVDFAILLLPFRAPSPLKHRGVLPDLGEIYTLVLLEAMARACEHAQETMIARARMVANSLTPAQLASYGSRLGASPASDVDCRDIMARAFAIVEAQALTVSENANRKRSIRESLFNRGTHEIRDAESFAELLAALSTSSLSFEAFAAFQNANIVPVSILALQDAERYPCFSDLSRVLVGEYRTFLIHMAEILNIETRYLDLIGYREFANRISDVSRSQRDAFYERRFHTLRNAILKIVSQLFLCRGKAMFVKCLEAIDQDGVIEPLFEPLLLSVQQPALGAYARKWRMEYEEVFFQCMAGIYEPFDDEPFEQLRQEVLLKTLEGVCQYCAAYEANTGLKNPFGFDDVAICFPNALRMSIHAKSETMGHFSIGISPSKTRTPWHGTAALDGINDGSSIKLSIDLAESLEATGKYVPVVVEDERGSRPPGPFCGHACGGQPIFYLSVDLLSANCEKQSGEFWRELGRRGLHDLTRAARWESRMWHRKALSAAACSGWPGGLTTRLAQGRWKARGAI